MNRTAIWARLDARRAGAREDSIHRLDAAIGKLASEDTRRLAGERAKRDRAEFEKLVRDDADDCALPRSGVPAQRQRALRSRASIEPRHDTVVGGALIGREAR